MRVLLLALWRFVYYKLTHVTQEKWRVLFVCLTLSAGLWFLRQMNKTYTTGMKVRLAFEYDRARYTPTEPLPDAIWLNVTAQGWPLALAAYGPGRPKLIVRPELSKGYWIADADKVKRYLQPKLNRVQINYLQDVPQPFSFDSLVRREVPIVLMLPGGRMGHATLCFQGLSQRLLRLPRTRVVAELPSDSLPVSLSLTALYGERWADVWCEDSVEIRP